MAAFWPREIMVTASSDGGRKQFDPDTEGGPADAPGLRASAPLALGFAGRSRIDERAAQPFRQLGEPPGVVAPDQQGVAEVPEPRGTLLRGHVLAQPQLKLTQQLLGPLGTQPVQGLLW